MKHPDLLVSGTFSSVLSQRRAQQVPSILLENREGEKCNPQSGGAHGRDRAVPSEGSGLSETLNTSTTPEGTRPSALGGSETCSEHLGPVSRGLLSSKEIQTSAAKDVCELEWILLLFLESRANPAV